MLVSEFALSPFLLDKYSILGLRGIIDTTQEIKEVNPKIQFLGLLPNMVSANSVTQKTTLNELQKQLSHLMLDKTAFILIDLQLLMQVNNKFQYGKLIKRQQKM